MFDIINLISPLLVEQDWIVVGRILSVYLIIAPNQISNPSSLLYKLCARDQLWLWKFPWQVFYSLEQMQNRYQMFAPNCVYTTVRVKDQGSNLTKATKAIA
jgi:hypothetical protein